MSEVRGGWGSGGNARPWWSGARVAREAGFPTTTTSASNGSNATTGVAHTPPQAMALLPLSPGLSERPGHPLWSGMSIWDIVTILAAMMLA
ncbi:hypothetical protein GR204_27670 [Rhizobium leguminosarum]|uniref:Uncharacterized protein n=1 Tax=Rhizobium leguminosarum TaxID=384 RepID=A0A6P0BDW7_RHILE|nr:MULTISPECIES: hypothetical protein [Rhizobium]MBY5846439.1 hypothetical protein [Rhizobium leguminosarum]NEI37698.1 hypothetical protein [Rhizobium leguminosarum]NEI44339.1 hypothetical protein [Rhizobium leguminosarum]QND23001.1 hypothetical protein HB774_25245 [Rhizobium leguminosarum bv. viciae]